MNTTESLGAPRVSDTHLVERAQKGDRKAFEMLYVAHRRRVFNVCLRMIEDCGRAEELMQDTFVQVYRKLHTFRGQSAFTTWLHRISVNVVLMYIRQNRARAHEVPIETNTEHDENNSLRESLGADDQRLNGAVDRVTLQNAVGQLPPGYRLVFVLHDVEGYQHHEIAEMLGCTVGNTKSQLHKARLAIRRYLRGEAMRQRGRRRAAA
jgi:RNA polymerase sigma-70 factor (ECF subfamily)